MDEEKKKTILNELSRGLEVTFHNAEELFKEAELLRIAGHHPRALVLHQISIEECGKIEIIAGHAMQLFLEGEIDLERMTKAFRSHKAKNYANAYFTEVKGDELEARKSGDTKAAVEAFKALQKDFHEDSNGPKNAGLYVDFASGQFITPEEAIPAKLAEEIGALNHYFLSLTWPKVGLIEKLLKDDGARKDALTWMTEKIKKLQENKVENLQEATEAILAEMLERFKKDVAAGKKA